MKPIHFKEVNITLAKNQKEYQPLPVQLNDELAECPATSCWELDEAEIAQIVKTKRFYLRQLLFRRPGNKNLGQDPNKFYPNPLQPIHPFVYNPFKAIEVAYYKTDMGTVVGMVPLEGGGFESIPAINLDNLIDNICSRFLELKTENLCFVLVDEPGKVKPINGSNIITE